MGYESHYTLTWDDTLPEPMIANIVKQWLADHEEARYCLNDDGSAEESGKWYDHEDDLRELSKRAPDVLFTLECVGEDGARWRCVANAGRLYKLQPSLIYAATPITPEVTIVNGTAL